MRNLSPTSADFLRQAITAPARQHLFERQDGSGRFDFIQDNVLRSSWVRCARLHTMTDRISFEPLPPDQVSAAVDRHVPLTHSFEQAVSTFAPALRRGGFHPVLTDAQAMILAHHGDTHALDASQSRALLTGIDMSERAIGTAGMNCALSSRRPVQVIGGEHFLLGNAHIQCAAAPIFSSDGQLVGAVNLAKFDPGQVLGALAFAREIAGRVELNLLRRLGGRTLLLGPGGLAAVAVGADGELLGITQGARDLLGLEGTDAPPEQFDEVFETRLAEALELLDRNGQADLQLASGLVVKGFSAPENERRIFLGGSRAVVPPAPPELGDRGFESEFAAAQRAIEHGLPLLLRGETGTGKEVLARALHAASPRAQGPFVAINCAALPETLIESELFGYGDGAFTGGRKGGAPGRAEEAQGGTLFLDEIGDMPSALQSRLLRLLDRREVTRLGSGKLLKLDFQLICATHQDLERMTATQVFRADLLYRIDGYTVTMPALRERRDRRQLFRKLVGGTCQHAPGIEEAALDILMGQRWPGNVRQVLSVLRRALLHVRADLPVDVDALQRALGTSAASIDGSLGAFNASMGIDKVASAEVDSPRLSSHATSGLLEMPLSLPLSDVEDRAIVEALRRTHGNVVKSAQLLGISRSTLQRRIRGRAALSRALRDSRD